MGFPVTEAKVIAAEERLERRLPEALRARLMRDNGGEITADDATWTLHPVFDDTDRKRMPRTGNHIVRETQSARDGWQGFRADAIVIADDGSGDLICLLPESDEFVVWRHETAVYAPIAVRRG